MLTNLDVLLLTDEWSQDRDGERVCTVCQRFQPGTSGFNDPKYEGHEAGCLKDLVIAERGFATQADRDAARKRLEAATEPTLPPPPSRTG